MFRSQQNHGFLPGPFPALSHAHLKQANTSHSATSYEKKTHHVKEMQTHTVKFTTGNTITALHELRIPSKKKVQI